MLGWGVGNAGPGLEEVAMSREPSTRLRRRPRQGASAHGPSVCPLCGTLVPPEMLELHAWAEDWVLETIREKNPSWVEPDGACQKCVEYYQKL